MDRPNDSRKAKIEASDTDTKKVLKDADKSVKKSANKMTIEELIKHWGTGGNFEGGKMSAKQYAKVRAKRRMQKKSRAKNRRK